jgi:hypothetical protein
MISNGRSILRPLCATPIVIEKDNAVRFGTQRENDY